MQCFVSRFRHSKRRRILLWIWMRGLCPSFLPCPADADGGSADLSKQGKFKYRFSLKTLQVQMRLVCNPNACMHFDLSPSSHHDHDSTSIVNASFVHLLIFSVGLAVAKTLSFLNALLVYTFMILLHFHRFYLHGHCLRNVLAWYRKCCIRALSHRGSVIPACHSRRSRVKKLQKIFQDTLNAHWYSPKLS